MLSQFGHTLLKEGEKRKPSWCQQSHDYIVLAAFVGHNQDEQEKSGDL